MNGRSNRLRPPMLATWLLNKVIVSHHREAVLSEMAELYRHRVHRSGYRAAKRWYRKQAVTFALQLLWHGRSHSRPLLHLNLPIASSSGVTTMVEFFNDVKRAARRLLRAPIFSTVSVFTLAIGIAVFTSVFALVEGVLLEPMPYRAPNQLAWVWRDYTWSSFPRGWLGGVDIVGLREQTNVFEQVVAVRTVDVNLSQDGTAAPARVTAMFVSPNLFDVLGVSPMLGRGFAVGEDDPDADAVVVLGFELWRAAFQADSNVLGEIIDLSGTTATVIGVAPKGFRFMKHGSLVDPVGADLYSNMRIDLAATSPGSGAFAGLVRIRPGVQAAHVDEALRTAAERSDMFFEERGLRLWTVGLQSDLTAAVRPALIALLIAAGSLLLVLTANMATLFLSRSALRIRELGICAALGASRRRLLSSVFTESVVVGVVGGVIGVGLAFAFMDVMLMLIPETLPRLNEIGIDLSVLAVAFAVTMGMTVLTGTAPALHATAHSIVSSLREGGRNSDSTRGVRFRSVLVVGQVALSLMLLVGAGLVAQAFAMLIRQDPGFDPGETVTFSVSLTFSNYTDAAAVALQHDRIRAEFATLPGVTGVGATNALPLTQATNQIDIEFPLAPGNVGDPVQDGPLVDVFQITDGYFDAAGFRVLTGRSFEPNDADREVVIIDDVLARRFYPGDSPIGRSMVFASDTLTVVGVVDQARLYNVFEDDRGQVYLHTAYRPTGNLNYVIRTELPPENILPSVRRVLSALDPAAPVSNVRSLQSIVNESLGEQRLSLTLLAAFALSALVLAVLGIYGVVASNVLRRRQEIGLRIALGATRPQVLRLVLGQGLRLTLLGGVLGLVGAFGISRLLDTMMFGVESSNPLIYGVVSILLVGAAFVASYFPAHAATRIDPVGTLNG